MRHHKQLFLIKKMPEQKDNDHIIMITVIYDIHDKHC